MKRAASMHGQVDLMESMSVPAIALNTRRFDLHAICDALCGLSRRMPQVNAQLENHHPGLDEDSVQHLLQAYALLDHFLDSGKQLLSMGQSGDLLALNHCVLFGSENADNHEFDRAFAASEEHFYGQGGAGVGELLSWYAAQHDQSVWMRAAGVFLRTLGPPQLFIEGNHRTGVLLVNFVLGMDRQPPLVIDQQFAPVWFERTEALRTRRRSFLDPSSWLQSHTAQMADMIRNQVSRRYLLERQESEY